MRCGPKFVFGNGLLRPASPLTPLGCATVPTRHSAAGRLLIAVAWNRFLVLLCLMSLIPFGEALAVPVLTIAIKRYTNHQTRTYAYGLFYTCMNLASLASGPITDG